MLLLDANAIGRESLGQVAPSEGMHAYHRSVLLSTGSELDWFYQGDMR